jgi:hypothetical protein
MTMRNETSKPEAADPVRRGCLANITPSGSVALSMLEKGKNMGSFDERGRLTANPNYPVSDPQVPSTAEAQDAPPVASGMDSTPTNWFELAADLCHHGYITETRMRRAIAAVRQGVDRA